VASAGADVVIVGGGIAGLAAAHALAKRGIPFTLLEAEDRFGGVVRTDAAEGFLLEAGPDTLLAQKPEGAALCRELGLGDRLVPTHPTLRTLYVLHRRRLHALPEGMVLAVPTRVLPLAGSRLFSWRGKLRMGLDLVWPRRREDGDESIGGFLRRRLGDEAVTRLGEPLLAGIHAGDPDRLSIRATFPRFVDLERRYGSLIRGLLAARPKAPSGPPPAVFEALRGGMNELVDALVARLPSSALRRGAPVRSLRREGGRFRVVVERSGEVIARSAIVAAPAPRAAPMLEELDAEIAGWLRRVPFASSATVFLGYRRGDVRHPLDGYGLVVPRTEGLRTMALTFVSTKLPERAPEGQVLLRGFFGGIRDPDVLSLDDAALVDTMIREMKEPLGFTGDPILTRVYRWPEATPQMEIGHLDRLAALEDRLRAVPGLFLTGAGIRSTGMPDMIADGTRAAEAAAAFLSG
jgi:oxygen-dependent protoporphyrinogen oxidase